MSLLFDCLARPSYLPAQQPSPQHCSLPPQHCSSPPQHVFTYIMIHPLSLEAR